ncbi:uncharacterized protein [Embiotoca jacksoni]|uniref:uncharacterized protein n=1 Tax=Embiotoca jacksoni TaxID=100190 RepID=UPI0037046318
MANVCRPQPLMKDQNHSEAELLSSCTSSIRPVNALRSTSAAPLLSPTPPFNPRSTMSLTGSLSNNNHTQVEIQLASRGRATNAHSQRSSSRRDNGVKAEASSGHSNPVKTTRTHNELHKELLLAHKKGLALSSRSELQQVLERRKKVQSDRDEEGQGRSPLQDVLLRRQQKQFQREKQQDEELQGDAQLMEFVRVRQNLRKIHTAIQDKAAHS